MPLPLSDSDLLGEENDLEAFLDSSLENDPVLRGILEEGMAQIVKAVFRLLNLQRRRDKGQAQGHRREEKLAVKLQKNVKTFDPTGPKNPTVYGDHGSSSKGPDDNPRIITMKTEVNSEEGEMTLEDGTSSESKPDPFVDSTSSDEGLKLDGGRKMALAGNGSKGKQDLSKPCCYFCQKTFPTPARLETHMTTHTKEKPVPSDVSGKEVSRKGKLGRHTRKRSHVKEPPFKCPHCGKECSQKQNLEDHIRRHLKKKPFKCRHPGCSSSFVGAGDLKKHARVHSGKKPFPCEYPNCGKHFTTKNGRDDHHRLHTGEKPFVCGCGKKFASSSNLRQHGRRCEEGDRATKRRRICQD